MKISESKILIVDDEIDLVEIAAESFESEGLSVSKAYSGEEALSLCKTIKFNVIVSDNHMPGIGGMELFKELNNIYQSDYFFYLCTGDVFINDDFKAIGGSMIISKPYDLFKLIDRIKADLKAF